MFKYFNDDLGTSYTYIWFCASCSGTEENSLPRKFSVSLKMFCSLNMKLDLYTLSWIKLFKISFDCLLQEFWYPNCKNIRDVAQIESNKGIARLSIRYFRYTCSALLVMVCWCTYIGLCETLFSLCLESVIKRYCTL